MHLEKLNIFKFTLVNCKEKLPKSEMLKNDESFFPVSINQKLVALSPVFCKE